MNSPTISPASIVHEAIDERQYVRTRIPATAVLTGGGLEQCECPIEDISLGGLGIRCEQPLRLGALLAVTIRLRLNGLDLNLEAHIKVVSQRDAIVGAEFVELDPQKRDILRYLISAYMAGEIADLNGLMNVMQRENYIKERKKVQVAARTPADRLKAAFGTLAYLAVALAAIAFIAYKAYLLFFRVEASHAVVSTDAYVVSMPDNGYVKYLLDPAQTTIRQGEQIVSVSNQLAASFNTPSDLQALADLSPADLQLLLGRALIETVISSPCDCDLFFPARRLDGYAYKAEPLVHLLPQDRPLHVKASVPFAKMSDLSRLSHVRLKVHGLDATVGGTVVASRVDEANQALLLTIEPDQPLPRTLYQHPVAVELFLGLPLLSR